MNKLVFGILIAASSIISFLFCSFTLLYIMNLRKKTFQPIQDNHDSKENAQDPV